MTHSVGKLRLLFPLPLPQCPTPTKEAPQSLSPFLLPLSPPFPPSHSLCPLLSPPPSRSAPVPVVASPARHVSIRAAPFPGGGGGGMSAGAGRGAAGPAVAKVELRLSCRHLLDRDPLTKSDPSVALLQPVQGRWAQVGTGTGTGRAVERKWMRMGRGRGRGQGQE